MSEPKPFASLSSGLLARKGAAKPAMRPQGFGSIGSGLEDLGWNDMGQGHPAPDFPSYEEPLPEHVPSSIAALTPAPKPQSSSSEEEAEPQEEMAKPAVVEQQRTIAERLAAQGSKPAKAEEPAARAVAPVVPLAAGKRPSQKPGRKSKAAFTLRLDPERHLKLRLACAVSNRSAQLLLTEALDDLLKSIPEVDALAGRLPNTSSKRS